MAIEVHIWANKSNKRRKFLSDDVFKMRVGSRATSSALDISGFAEIPETPRRPASMAQASLRALRRPPLEGDYISVTDSSGTRVYLRKKEDTGAQQVNVTLPPKGFFYIFFVPHTDLCRTSTVMSSQAVDSRLITNSSGGLGLLAVPIAALREQEAERVRVLQMCQRGIYVYPQTKMKMR